MNRKLRVGIVGLGNIGMIHFEHLSKMEGCRIAAICDNWKQKVEELSEKHQIDGYTDYTSMLDSGGLDAIVVATPHYQHPAVAIEALRRNIHVLVEKPVAVHVNDAEKMISVYEEEKRKHPNLIFAAVHQQRNHAHWLKIKEMLTDNVVGRLIRFSWINTGWFRTQAYFNSASWRGTWKGEGGGVLINQCAHNIDLLWWFFGLPERVISTARFGKNHNIEVEDEVHSILEYRDGLTGQFTASTSEFPGTDRLEIVGEYGKIVYEDNKIALIKNKESTIDVIKNSKNPFAAIEYERIEIAINNSGNPGHDYIIRNFIDSIREVKSPFVTASEGLYSVMLLNGMILSAVSEKKVRLPFDGDEYEKCLEKLIAESNYIKPEVETGLAVNMKDSFK